MTIVGLNDFVKVSISAEFKSFLLIMCKDAPESTTNSLSSGLRVDGTSTYFPKVRRMLFYFSALIWEYFWPASTLAHKDIALVIPSLLETDPQILKHWGYADEDHLGISFRAKDFGLDFFACDAQRLSWILHIGLVSVCLSSSVKSMKTSAAPYPEIRNPIVVYLMSRTLRVSTFFRKAHVSSTWPLHFCHHSFRTICWAVHQPGDAHKSTFPQNGIHSRTCRTSTLEDAIFHRMDWCKFLWGNPCTALGLLPLGLRVLDGFRSLCRMKEFRDGFDGVTFPRLFASWRKLQLSPFTHCPLVSHCQQSPRILCTRCFVPWFLTTAFFSKFPFLLPKFLFRISCSILLFIIVFNLW